MDRGTYIAAADLQGGARRVLVRRDPGSFALGPTWSPDGSHLAFARVFVARQLVDVDVVAADGTGLHRLLRTKFGTLGLNDYSSWLGTRPIAWSPDGRSLAFADQALFVLAVDAGGYRVVAHHACRPVWSPDGATLAYLGDTDCAGERGGLGGEPGYRTIETVAVDGTGRRTLATGSFGTVVWSPNGLQLAFSTGCDVHHGEDWLCAPAVMNADGSARRMLATSLDLTYGIDWSVDAARLFVSRYLHPVAIELTGGAARASLVHDVVGRRAETDEFAVAPDPAGRAARGLRPQVSVVDADASTVESVVVPGGWRALDVAVALPR